MKNRIFFAASKATSFKFCAARHDFFSKIYAARRGIPLKICAASAIILIAFALVSCSIISGYSEPEAQRVISALGFDIDDEGVTVSARLVEEEGKSGRTINGVGPGIDEAISSLAAGETKALEGTHIAIIALGENVDKKWFDKILDFCTRNKEISLSAQLISCPNANELLSVDSVGGYEISESIRKSRESSSAGAECRLYQVKSALLREGSVFALPYFTSEGTSIELFGVRIYRGGGGAVILNRAETAYYMMIRGLFDGGLLAGDESGISGSVGVSNCKTKYEFSVADTSDTNKNSNSSSEDMNNSANGSTNGGSGSGKNDGTNEDTNGSTNDIASGDANGGKTNAHGTSVRIKLKVKCTLKLDSEVVGDEYASAVVKSAKSGMEKLYSELSERYGDLFGFSEAAAKQGLSDENLFDLLDVEFECTESGRKFDLSANFREGTGVSCRKFRISEGRWL